MPDSIATVIGVGAQNGLGAALCRRAAAAGLHVVAAGRTESKLAVLVDSLRANGGSASAEVVDVTQEGQVEALFATIDGLPGALELVAYNAGNAFVHETLTMTGSYFEEAWRVCCYGGFVTGREAGKRLAGLGRGSILFTGATASLRSRPPYLAFASAKAALRAVASGLARELGPKGVHVGHVIIDGGIDGERLNSKAPGLKEKLGEHGMLDPDAIAESYWQLHRQHPSAWTFELDLRPFKESF